MSSTFSSPTVPSTFHNDHSTPPPPDSAAARIQSAYRSRAVRNLTKTLSAVNQEASELQSLIQRQDTVDAMRRSEKERFRINESLMRLLLRLDSVPGADPAVREARRKVSRRIVAMQEIVDAICESDLEAEAEEGYLWNWDMAVEKMEEEVCRERGGDEMERFCAQYLGFRCFQRFLHEP